MALAVGYGKTYTPLPDMHSFIVSTLEFFGDKVSPASVYIHNWLECAGAWNNERIVNSDFLPCLSID